MTDEERFSLVPQDVPQIASYVPGVRRLGIPAQKITDGPLGVTNPAGERRGDTATALSWINFSKLAVKNPAVTRNLRGPQSQQSVVSCEHDRVVAGETIRDINDLLFDKSGRVATVVIGVGGFLGLGEKNVAVPSSSLSFTADANGKRVVTVPLSKERLQTAPEFKATEKTAYMRAKETAAEMGQKAADKARELGDKAGKTIEDMRK